MQSVGGAEIFALVSSLLSCVLPVGIIAVALYWVATRAKRALARGQQAMAEGRLVDALKAFELCNDKLLLSGQAKLWLWRLGDGIADLEQAVRFNSERYEETAAPFVALIAALRNERDVHAWLRRSGASLAGASPAARIAEAVMAMRGQNWQGARNWLASGTGGLGLRAEKLVQLLDAWALSNLDGESRELDVVGMLGEGSVTELQNGWPELGQVLQAGRATPLTPPASPFAPASPAE